MTPEYYKFEVFDYDIKAVVHDSTFLFDSKYHGLLVSDLSLDDFTNYIEILRWKHMASDLSTENGLHKYRRVVPIFGLLFYYIGSLIVSLEVANSVTFLIQIAIFSIVLIVGLQWPMNKWAVILGAILVMVGSAGPLAEFIISIQSSSIGFGTLGGLIVLIGVIFQAFAIIIWLKE